MLFFKTKITPITIETERFTLKRVTADQLAKDTFHWSKDVELMRTLGVQSAQMTFKKWRKTFKSLRGHYSICWAIFPKGTDDFIGYHSVQIDKSSPGQLTIVIEDRDWWGKNVVIETRSAVCDYMFSKTDCSKVYGLPLARNLPSIFNYQSLGFKVEGVMRQHTKDFESDEMVDVIVFGMLREEWLALQKSKTSSNSPGIETKLNS